MPLLAPPPLFHLQESSQPNVILIVADDLGYSDLGCYGATDIQTPNIDALAGAGMRLTNGYVVSPICAPTRAGLMSGRYPQRFGFEFNLSHRTALNYLGLPTTETTLAERLKAVGYNTAMVGKWHLGEQDGLRPLDRGFDSFYGFLGGGSHYLFTSNTSPITNNGAPVTPTKYLTDEFADQAVDFINQQGSNPFFLYLAFNAPHTPLEAPQEYLDRYPNLTGNRKIIAAMISALDDGVGSISAALRANNLDENTIVIFVSDNGGVVANGSSNNPLRGGKYEVLEGGVRVPFIIKWPEVLPPGSVYSRSVSVLDIVPTVMAAAQDPVEAGESDGVDVRPFLLSPTGNPHETLYWRYGGKRAVLRFSKKLVREDEYSPETLFSLLTDPGEATDIISTTSPNLLNLLETSLANWESQLATPLWGYVSDPTATSLALYRKPDTTQMLVATLDYHGHPVSSFPLRSFAGSETAKIGRFRPEADIDIATLHEGRIVVRSFLADGTKLQNLSFDSREATSILGFADFNLNGRNEILIQTPEGLRGVEISPETGAIDFIFLYMTEPTGDFTRVLGFADVDFDGGPDMVLADSHDRISYLYFDGKRSQRMIKKNFNPNVATTTKNRVHNLVGSIDINGDGSPDIINNPNGDTLTLPLLNSEAWVLERLKLGAIVAPITVGPDWLPVSFGASDVADPLDN